MKYKQVISLIYFLLTVQQFYAQVSITNLRCEMLMKPLGIDVKEPRFSWELSSNQRNVQQTAYQIIVSSTEEKLSKEVGDIWNSGKQNSSQSNHVAYAGKSLQSATKYFWKVKVLTNKGEATSTETAFFSTGLLNSKDWKAKWIGYDKASPWEVSHNGQGYRRDI
jgi:alpha-L-rhamnosidase